jgi:bifunctional N-acetylglucosamine-1-phosphate-uridyltransferase/glucosamine-1-phosphate-acetyltransferase GlmU-like protein
VWSVLHRRLAQRVDRIHVIMSPAGAPSLAATLASHAGAEGVSVSVQDCPTGMGDAIFGAVDVWTRFARLLVIWGDQVHVAGVTIDACLDQHAGRPGTAVIPLVRLARPYVEYRFDAEGRLTTILQEREGDLCQANGLGDVGTFVLSTARLPELWAEFVMTTRPGQQTGERNFLPFLVFLSQAGWSVEPLLVGDPEQARGINTPDDLAHFRTLYRGECEVLS